MSGCRFRSISSAPRDGTTIEVKHGRDQEVVRAYWAAQTFAWVKEGDPTRKTLHDVPVWRPVERATMDKIVSDTIAEIERVRRNR